MKTKRLNLVVAAVVVLFIMQYAEADLATLDKPGASKTYLFGIDGGNIVGYYEDGHHGLLYNGTDWLTLDKPGASSTTAYDIDGDNIVGAYLDSSGEHGFLYDGTDWTPLDVPGASLTRALGIDGNYIVGVYSDSGVYKGFLYNMNTVTDKWTYLDFPSSTETYLQGIDMDAGTEGIIVANGKSSLTPAYYVSWLYDFDDDAWTQFIGPGGTPQTSLYGIDGDHIIGGYTDGSSPYRGFLYNMVTDTWTYLDAYVNGQRAVGTYPKGIDGDNIVGYYDADTPGHGFIYTINQPPVAVCQNVTVEVGPGCVAAASIDNGSYDPDGDAITITQDPPGPYPLGETEVTLTVTDDSGSSDTCTATVTVVDTTPPVIVAATVGPQLVKVGQTVNFDAVVDDECDPTVEWNFGDGDSSPDIVATHTYSAADIYTVTLTVTDISGNSATEEFIVVVYDLSGGFVTGGGWIYSEPDAYVPNPALEGKANFGFVSKYKKGATAPTGNTEFVFKAGDLNFHSSSYEWLVVTGSDYARFKGWGSINGYGDYRFMLWAGDGPDTFRIRIWTEDDDGVETDVYDNGMDQPIGGGSIVIHTK